MVKIKIRIIRKIKKIFNFQSNHQNQINQTEKINMKNLSENF
jgi:hypothetical protein